jgi:hypothetical protein
VSLLNPLRRLPLTSFQAYLTRADQHSAQPHIGWALFYLLSVVSGPWSVVSITLEHRALAMEHSGKFEILNPKHEMVRLAVRQAHGPEQSRRTHHPEQSRRANPNDRNSNDQNGKD